MKLELANEKNAANGWTFDYEMLDQISKETQESGWPVGMEQVEAVLMVLQKHGILVPNG